MDSNEINEWIRRLEQREGQVPVPLSVTPPTADEGPSCSLVIEDEPTQRPSWWKRRHWVTKCVLIGLIITVIGSGPASWQAQGDIWNMPLFLIGCCLMIGVPIVYFIYRYAKLLGAELDAAMEPLPSLAEIEQQLRAEGYDPSIADCVALHQMLQSERNQHTINAAVGLGGAYAASRAAQGKRLF